MSLLGEKFVWEVALDEVVISDHIEHLQHTELLDNGNIDKVDITSNIQYRYAKTVVKVYVKNPSMSMAQEVKFQMVLPVTAFISNFTI